MSAKEAYAEIMPAVRKFLYVPDGRPPAGWSERRDASIARELMKRYRFDRIVAAIEGLAILRDQPGVYGDPVDWLPPGTKTTMRALYNSRSGVAPVFEKATAAYWKHGEARDRDRPAGGFDVQSVTI